MSVNAADWCRNLSDRLHALVGRVRNVGIPDKARAIKKLFAEVDRDIETFRRKMDLSCPQRCGHCCENARVETTELDMLPMAMRLVRLGEAERLYEAADRLEFEGRCVLYHPDEGHTGRGRCGCYELRPLVCRMFAFSGNPDKHGQNRLVVCGVLRDRVPDTVRRACAQVESGAVRPPLMADYILKAAMPDPEMAREQLPINLAFKRAVDRVWLYRKFHS
ncbi:MAG: YkgJ family cysteine cluster protein [Candidatus Omnitrophica bacterium]|nr:YkgJ family cysteine cluster protein [Candidatus Omnitrophota bacterium]